MKIKVIKNKNKKIKKLLLDIIKTGYCEGNNCSTLGECFLGKDCTEVCLTGIFDKGKYTRDLIKKAAYNLFIKKYGETSFFEEIL